VFHGGNAPNVNVKSNLTNMPVTAVRTKTKTGEEMRLQFITIPSENGLLIDIYMCDPEFVPTGKPEHLIEEVDEVEYHKKLREAATEAAEFEPGYSSNPEWNPGYVDDEPQQLNP
jgi:hypothetical protein